MVKKRVTSKMVAERAGVSQTTVSFVLNKVEGQNISPETTERVRKVARDLGYVPDAAARMLARGVSDNIALVLTRPHKAVLSDEYIAYILTGIGDVLRHDAYRILVEFVDEDSQTDAYLNLARGNGAIGLLVIPYLTSPADIRSMVTLSEEGFPIVTLGFCDDRIHSVSIRDIDGIRDALRHLVDMGHRRIGTISYAPKESAIVPHGRLQTYRQFLQDAALSVDETLIEYGAFSPDSGYHAMRRLLANDQPPTAILAMNDVMAFGAMKAIIEQGLRIPEDIAVIGYDGIHLAAFANPALTTVHAPNVEQGKLAASMLIDIINARSLKSRHIELSPELVIRDSCGHHLKHRH